MPPPSPLEAGQEKFHALGPIYYREANGALLVYDVTNPDSLKKVRDWVKELNKMLGSQNIRLAIIGNKVDLLSPSEQKSPNSNPLVQEAIQYADELTNARHYLTSAKLNHGLGDLFVSLSRRMVEQHKRLVAARETSARALASSRAIKTISLADDTSGNGDETPPNYYVGNNWRQSNLRLDQASRYSGPSGGSSCRCWDVSVAVAGWRRQ